MKECNCNAKLSIENHYPDCSYWQKGSAVASDLGWKPVTRVVILGDGRMTISGNNHGLYTSNEAMCSPSGARLQVFDLDTESAVIDLLTAVNQVDGISLYAMLHRDCHYVLPYGAFPPNSRFRITLEVK